MPSCSRPSAPVPEGRKVPWAHSGCLGIGSRRRARQAAIGPKAQTAFSQDSRMGPSRRHGRLPRNHPHAGTARELEHLKYPEEEKSTEIARVAASESARAQTCDGAKAGAVIAGHCGTQARSPQAPAAVTKPRSSGTAWEGRPQQVKPRTRGRDCGRDQSRARHVKPGPKQRGPPSRLNTLR